MRSVLAAVAFLTRLPVGRLVAFDAVDVGRSFGWFPLVGGLLGLAAAGTGLALRDRLPAVTVTVLIVALEALLTGALHLDGLADSADGFGGGKDRDDILRIMRDHAIGSYGAVALVSILALKVSAYSALLATPQWLAAALAAPVLGRLSLVILSVAVPYARASSSVVNQIGKRDLVLAALLTAVLLAVLNDPRAWAGTLIVLLTTACTALYSKRRIGGITGDVLGANLQLAECAVLVAFLWKM